MYSRKIYSFDNYSVADPKKYHNLYVYQVSEVFVASGDVVEEHTQICDEITYAISGEATIYNNGEPCTIKAGDIHIVSKGETHEIVVDQNKNFRYVCFGIGLNPENASYSALQEIFSEDKIVKIKAADEIRTLVTMLMNELYVEQEFQGNMVEMLILQILVSLYRKRPVEVNLKSKENFSGKAVYEILRYIDTNLTQIKNIQMISENLSYSRYYISHIFKDKIGMTVNEYITRRKIDMAIELLKDGRMRISEVAEKLNYESTQSFSKMFKKQTGLTPGQFIKQKAENNQEVKS